MKKRISTILAALVILSLVSALSINIAASVIETPTIPIKPTTPTTTPAEVRLTSDVDGTVRGGTTVNFTTEISKLPTKGVSSVELVYTYSDSLEFNGNITTSGLPAGFEISEYTDKNNKISFNISSSNTAQSTFTVSFSFDVAINPTSDLYVKLYTVSLKDGDAKSVDVKVSTSTVYFEADSIVPLFEHIGASLRINNTPALRFAMRVEKDDAYKSLKGTGKYTYSSGDTLKFGMLYIPESKLTGELEVDTKDAHKEIFKSAFTDNANELVFAYTVENFSGNTTNFVTRPFIIYESNGEILYFYGEAKVRSASQVAKAELKSTTDTAKKAMLNKFIEN